MKWINCRTERFRMLDCNMCDVILMMSSPVCLQRASVCLKAYESLLLLSSLQSGDSGELLCDHTQLGELLAGRLLELYALLPVESLEPGELQSWPHTSWRYTHLTAHLTTHTTQAHTLVTVLIMTVVLCCVVLCCVVSQAACWVVPVSSR